MLDRTPLVHYDYDLKKSPPTYDFLTWLVLMDDRRQANNADKMRIRLVHGDRYVTERDCTIGPARREWRIRHLLPELCKLMPSVESVSVGMAGGQEVGFNSSPYPFKAALVAPSYAHSLLPFQGDFITLTVRQSWTQTDRDTNQKTWCDVMEKMPLPVVVVPDTEAERIGQPCIIPFGKRYAPAAFSPTLRMALYEKAKLNLFTSGGPMMMAAFSNVNAEVFGLRVESVRSCGEPWLEVCGLLDGRRVQNTVFHWNALPEQIIRIVKARLDDR